MFFLKRWLRDVYFPRNRFWNTLSSERYLQVFSFFLSFIPRIYTIWRWFIKRGAFLDNLFLIILLPPFHPLFCIMGQGITQFERLSNTIDVLNSEAVLKYLIMVTVNCGHCKKMLMGNVKSFYHATSETYAPRCNTQVCLLFLGLGSLLLRHVSWH